MGPESCSLSKAVMNQVVMWLLCLTTIIPALLVVAIKWTKQKGCQLGRFQLHILVCHSQTFLQPVKGIQLPSMPRGGEYFGGLRKQLKSQRFQFHSCSLPKDLPSPLCIGEGNLCGAAVELILGCLASCKCEPVANHPK